MLRFIFLLFFIAFIFTKPAFANREDDPSFIIKMDVADMFWKKDYAGLEEQARRNREEKLKASNGVWKTTYFYRSFRTISSWKLNSEEEFNKVFDRLEEWEKQFPHSPAPQIAKAQLIYGFAQSLRGEENNDVAPGYSYMPYLAELRKAEGILMSNREMASNEPEWYALLGQIMLELNSKRTEIDSIILDGINRHPEYMELYDLALKFLLPKWQENLSQINELASSGQMNSEDMGSEIYARVYWKLSQYAPEKNIFFSANHESLNEYELNGYQILLDWSVMRQGIEQIVKKYPSEDNLNHMALMACLARDKDLTKNIISKIEAQSIDLGCERIF